MDSIRGFARCIRSRNRLAIGAGMLCVAAGAPVFAGPAVGVNVGTTGVGTDVNIPVLPILGVRVGYSGFTYHRDIDQTDVSYAGRLHFSEASGLLDWYVLAGGLRLTAGVYAPPKSAGHPFSPCASDTLPFHVTTLDDRP